MTTHVTVHLDLRPENNRDNFNTFMEIDDWKKVLVVFTTWYRPFATANADVARDEAIKSVRAAAKSAKVKFDGVVVAGNSPPIRFDMSNVYESPEDEFSRKLSDYIIPEIQ